MPFAIYLIAIEKHGCSQFAQAIKEKRKMLHYRPLTLAVLYTLSVSTDIRETISCAPTLLLDFKNILGSIYNQMGVMQQ